MKKIGVFVALALIVTVGGTYAAWNYTTVADGAVENATGTANITLVDVTTTEVTNGTIKIEENSVTVSIDDDGKHNAVLTVEGRLVISFTGNASGTAVNGLNLQCTATDDCTQYRDKDVFKYTMLNANREVGNGTDQDQPFAQWIIEGEDLKTLIALNGTITADTLTEYNALKAAIAEKKITITVSAVK